MFFQESKVINKVVESGKKWKFCLYLYVLIKN
jgi:hypothetical protein